MNNDTLILDTETTGVSGEDRVVELSIIDTEGTCVYSCMFNPGMPMPEEASAVNGITDEMLADKPTFAMQAPSIAMILRGKRIAGWNVPFDARMLRNEFIRLGMPEPWSSEWDAMDWFAARNGIAPKRNGTHYCKLIQAKEMMGLGDSQQHRALGDCLDTLAVINASRNR